MLIARSPFALPNPEGIQDYQNNIHLSAEHKEKLANDISLYHHADNIWDVLREEFTLNHYEDNPIVQEKIQWYMNNQNELLRAASRAAPYLYYILQQVKKKHLPAELVLIPIIESGYNPFSLSNKGAAGLWQLMPGTASGLGIQQDASYDGRRDVIASTRAALVHFAYLQSFFDGNWLLAIAAYNTGEGNVLAAIKRNIRNGKNTNFWSLPVAQETKDYVPSILALAVIISHPDQYPIYFPPVRNAPYLGQIEVGSQINIKTAAILSGVSYKKMTQLNPGFNNPTAKTPYKLVLPIENVEQFTENLARSPLNTPINWLHYKVKSGDNLASIARRFATTSDAIRKMNHLSRNSVKQGIDLLIPYESKNQSPQTIELAQQEIEKTPINIDDDGDENKITPQPLFAENDTRQNEQELASVTLASFSQKYVLQPGDTVYMVRSKDSLDSIAKHFHLNKQTLKIANQLQGNKVKPGTSLIIPTHVISTTSALASASPKKSTTKNNPQPGDTVYMVRRGDTIEKIARKFKTTPSAIRLANMIERESMQEGEQLLIPTHYNG